MYELGGGGGMEDSKSVPVDLPLGLNEPTVPTGSRTQQSEPIGDKNRITCMALKRARCAGLGEDNGEVVCGGQGTEECGPGDGRAEVADRSQGIRVDAWSLGSGGATQVRAHCPYQGTNSALSGHSSALSCNNSCMSQIDCLLCAEVCFGSTCIGSHIFVYNSAVS
jgi:hypothetical protein